MAFSIQSSKNLHAHLRKWLSQNARAVSKNCILSDQVHFSQRQSNTLASKSEVQPKFISPKESEGISHSLNLVVGDKLNGFKVKQIEEIPEFSLTAVKLVHEVTQAEYLHIDKKDSNNAFSVLFRTTPTDSTGLPHILEHTVLCGSKRFPCRDPFFKMLNRSLASFMNAMTAPDWTMYPFLTQNNQDYKNLMSVYLDAVYCPLLKETDFNQEGWRLEYTDTKDTNSSITIKGVVFNEMKGVFSDNQNIFQEALMNNILPSHTYSVCSGGDPLVIPNLTYDDLKNFHNNYYSPYNAKYYSYGDMPLSEHLKFIDEQYLKDPDLIERGKLNTQVPAEKRWSKPVHKHVQCRVNPLAADKNKQSSIAISQLCCSITDIEERFVLQILAQLLTSGPNSSFYKTLIEPNIGSGFSPVTGFEGDTRDTFFTVALQEVAEKDFKQITQIYENTIEDIIEKGFDPRHLESILHSIELNTKHQTSSFGLGLLFNIASTWNHDGDIISLLKIESKMESFRKKIVDDPKYLQKKVKQYFKDNNHKLVLTMSPDPDFELGMKRKEDDVLKEKLKVLDEVKKRIIYENGLKLLEEQQHDDKSCLPTLSVKDLNREIEIVDYHDKKVSGIPFRLIPQSTNGVTYFRGILNTKDFTEEEMSLLPLFSLISTNMGTKRRNYKDFHQLVTLKTGGLSVNTHFITDTKNLNMIEESLSISSYCLNKNLDAMFDLWLELFNEMELSDVNRFETLVKGEAADLVNGIVKMGHRYAMLASGSLVSPVGKKNEARGGMTYVNRMKNIVQSPAEELLERIRLISKAVVTKSSMRFATNTPSGAEDLVLNSIAKFMSNVSASPGYDNCFETLEPFPAEHDGIFYVLPIQVNFASKALLGVPYEHEDFAPLRVMTRLLTMKFLHPEIREKAGAYGCGLNLSQSGLLSFYSYSDPNPMNSLEVFDKSARWLLEKNFTDEDVGEAKLGIFQSVDAPVAPGDKGMREFLYGVSDEALREHRLRLMKVTPEELIEIGVKYLDETKSNQPVGRAVIGQENKLILENCSCNWKVFS